MKSSVLLVVALVQSALAVEKPRLGGSVENVTSIYADGAGSITDAATVRLEGSWTFARLGAIESHLLFNAALRPLDPFSLMRDQSLTARLLTRLVAASFGPLDSIMALETAALDPATQAWLAGLSGIDLDDFLRHLPYSSVWPRNTFTLDRAVVRLFFNRLDMHVGRQVIAWGTGYAWNPTDIWNIKNPADPSAPKTGINALRAELSLGDRCGLSAVISPGSDINHTSGGFRFKGRAGRFDLSVSGMRVFGDDAALLGLPVRVIAGADAVGELDAVGVWGECAVVNPVYPGGDYTAFDSLYVQADIGADYTFASGLHVLGEYYFNGLGKNDPADCTPVDLLRMLEGRMAGLGRHYAMIGANYSFGGSWTASLFGLGNLSDVSCMLLPEIEYDFRGSIAVRLGVQIALGNHRESEYGGLYHSAALTLSGYF